MVNSINFKLSELIGILLNMHIVADFVADFCIYERIY